FFPNTEEVKPGRITFIPEQNSMQGASKNFFKKIFPKIAWLHAIFRDFSGIVRGSSPISIIERKISALNSMKHNHNFPRRRKQREPKKAVSACS
ncbi:MAG: hypothetical protein IIU42_06305, partial [Ruminococcus sp.]|nr:hypothetical protein [Ruminococcus sp.]